MGQLTDAGQYPTEHLNLAHRIGARSAEAYALSWLGYWELSRGNYIAAAEYFQHALSTQQELRTEHMDAYLPRRGPDSLSTIWAT